MNCRYCGKKMPDDSIFCPFCGKKAASHLRVDKGESHLRLEDRIEEREEREKNIKKEKVKKEKNIIIEESDGKRRVKSLISIIAAMIFVVGAFIAIMVFVKPYLGEEPWPDEGGQAAETEENIGFPKAMYISAEGGQFLRKDPGTEGKEIHFLNYGQEIQVEKIADGWAYASADGLSGWCSTEHLTENIDEIVQTETKPESDADKGRLVEPSKHIDTGYHGTVNSEGGLNLRCGPGPDYDILMVVPYETEVIEEGWNNGWIYISYDGQYGWVNSEFITPTGEVENMSS